MMILTPILHKWEVVCTVSGVSVAMMTVAVVEEGLVRRKMAEAVSRHIRGSRDARQFHPGWAPDWPPDLPPGWLPGSRTPTRHLRRMAALLAGLQWLVGCRARPPDQGP